MICYSCEVSNHDNCHGHGCTCPSIDGRVHPNLVEPSVGLRLNTYAIISRAVEEGTELGYNRSHKHTDTPTPAVMQSSIYEAIMELLCEVIEFEAV